MKIISLLFIFVLSSTQTLPMFREGAFLTLKKGIYRHFKNQDFYYRVFDLAKAFGKPKEEMVLYKALYGIGESWARPIESFMGTLVPPGNIAPISRFTFISEVKSDKEFQRTDGPERAESVREKIEDIYPEKLFPRGHYVDSVGKGYNVLGLVRHVETCKPMVVFEELSEIKQLWIISLDEFLLLSFIKSES